MYGEEAEGSSTGNPHSFPPLHSSLAEIRSLKIDLEWLRRLEILTLDVHLLRVWWVWAFSMVYLDSVWYRLVNQVWAGIWEGIPATQTMSMLATCERVCCPSSRLQPPLLRTVIEGNLTITSKLILT